MDVYDFELLFALPGGDDDPADHIEALHRAGCTDALPGIGRRGRVVLTFTREAESAFTAVLSATGVVTGAIRGARLAEAAREPVGCYKVDDRLLEVAGVTRQVNLAIAGQAAYREAQRAIRALLR